MWGASLRLLFLSGKWEDPTTTPGLLRSDEGRGGEGRVRRWVARFLTIHCQKTSSRRRHSRAACSRAFSLCSLRSSCNANH